MPPATIHDVYDKYAYATPVEEVLMVSSNTTSFTRFKEYSGLSVFKDKEADSKVEVEKNFIESSAKDILDELGDISDEEYNYYESL